MSAHPVSDVFAAIDSKLVPDLSDLGLTGARASIGAATTEGAAATRRSANPAPHVNRVDLEPHWSAAIDAATD